MDSVSKRCSLKYNNFHLMSLLTGRHLEKDVFCKDKKGCSIFLFMNVREFDNVKTPGRKALFVGRRKFVKFFFFMTA